MLTETDLRKGLISTIKLAVGPLLSTTKTTTGTTPSVFRSGQNNLKPQSPYITVDHIDVGNSNSRTISKVIEKDENDDPTGLGYYYADSSIFQIKCCGNNAAPILKELKKKLEMESFRLNFEENSGGAKILQVGRVISTPNQLATEYSDDYVMQVTVNYIDSLLDNTVYTIDTITIESSNGSLQYKN